MQAITIYLRPSGTVSEFLQDFNVYQDGDNTFILKIAVPLRVFPKNIPNSGDLSTIAVTVAEIGVDRKGERFQTEKHNLKWIKDFEKDGVKYKLYSSTEDDNLGDLTRYSGTHKLVTNVLVALQGQDLAHATKLITSQECNFTVQPSAFLDNNPPVTPGALDLTNANVNYLLEKMSALPSPFNIIHKYNIDDLPVDVTYTPDGYNEPLSAFYGATHTIPITATKTASKTGVNLFGNISLDLVSPGVIGYQNETFIAGKTVVSRQNSFNVSQADLGIYTLIANGPWKPLNIDWLNDLSGKITTNSQIISRLAAYITTSEYPVGSTTYNHVPTSSELDAFVLAETGRQTQLGDTIYYVLTSTTETDTVWKAKYSGGEIINGEVVGATWQAYQIPGMQNAENDQPGLIEGTNHGDFDEELIDGTKKVLVDISSGQVTDILVKNRAGEKQSIGDLILAEADNLQDQVDTKADDSAVVKLASTTTQVLDSDISLAKGKKFLGTNEAGEEHTLISLGEYDSGEQVEVGMESAALYLNHKEVEGWSTPNIAVNYTDKDGEEHTENVAYLNDIAAHNTDTETHDDIRNMVHDENTRAVEEEQELEGDISALESRMTTAEGDISTLQADASNYVANANNPIPLVTEETLEVTSTGALRQTQVTKDITSNAEVSSETRIVIPVVDTAARLFLPQEQEVLRDLEAWHESMSGEALNYETDLSDIPAGDTGSIAVQTYLTDKYAEITNSESDPLDQTTITDETLGVSYRWYTNEAQWYLSHGNAVSIATNNIYNESEELVTGGSIGTVIGSTKKFHAFAEVNGELSVNGLDDLETQIENNTTDIELITTALNDEITRAEEADEANAEAIATEQGRAEEAETAINSELSNRLVFLTTPGLSAGIGNIPLNDRDIAIIGEPKAGDIFFLRETTTTKVPFSVMKFDNGRNGNAFATAYIYKMVFSSASGYTKFLYGQCRYNHNNHSIENSGLASRYFLLSANGGETANKTLSNGSTFLVPSTSDYSTELTWRTMTLSLPSIPTQTSAFENNGEGTLFNTYPDKFAKTSQVPTKTSQLANDSNLASINKIQTLETTIVYGNITLLSDNDRAKLANSEDTSIASGMISALTSLVGKGFFASWDSGVSLAYSPPLIRFNESNLLNLIGEGRMYYTFNDGTDFRHCYRDIIYYMQTGDLIQGEEINYNISDEINNKVTSPSSAVGETGNKTLAYGGTFIVPQIPINGGKPVARTMTMPAAYSTTAGGETVNKTVGASGTILVPQITSAGAITWRTMTLNSAFPASDVSAWAKASSKPAYTASEIIGNLYQTEGSIGNNGYCKLSNGLILQWGTSSKGSGSQTVNFSTAFNNTSYSVFLTQNSGGSLNQYNNAYYVNQKSTSSMTVDSGFTETRTYAWFAIGV